jgi:excisionase family DNA binding protein
MAIPLTTQQAAADLGVSQGRVNALIAAGRLKAQKIGMQWLIDKKELAKVRNRKPGRPKGRSKSTKS